MNCGLIKSFDYFEVRLEPSGEYSTGGGLFAGSATTHYRSGSLDYAVGIKLESTYGTGGWQVHFEIPDYSKTRTVSGLGSGNVRARVYAGGLYAFQNYWRLTDVVVKIYLDGILDTTWTLGDIDSATGKWPSQIPLIGIPPVIGAGCTMPTLDEPHAGTTATAGGTSVGGWRWIVGGTDEAFTATLPGTIITPPGISCGVAGGTLPGISVTDTWSASVDAHGTLSSSSTVITSEYTSAYVLPVPDIPRRYRRIGDDYRALVFRGGFPDVIQHGYSRCVSQLAGFGPVTTTADTYTTEIAARADFLATVEAAAHPYEDALNDSVPSLFKQEVTTAVVTYSAGVFVSSYSHTDRAEMDGAESVADPICLGLHTTERPTRYWDFNCNPHWSHTLWFEDWSVDASPVDLNDYWEPVRQQWIYNSALPEDEQYRTRNNIVLDASHSNAGVLGWWELYVGHAFRQLGATRWQTRNIAPRTSYAYTSSTSSLWTDTDCSISFGADLAVTADTGKTDVVIELDLGSFTSAPYLWPHIADQIKAAWTTTGISAIAFYIVGVDGTKKDITAVNGSWVDKPTGTTAKYAGSWAIANGRGVVSQTGADSGPDMADGVSAATMLDPERATAFELLPGFTAQKLRIEITLTTPGGTVHVNYPELRQNHSADPGLVWESGQCAALLWDSFAGVRFGNLDWWDSGSVDVYATPVLKGLGYQATVIDGLSFEKELLEGIQNTSGLNTDLTGYFDSLEGDTREGASDRTAAVFLPDPSFTRWQLAIMNLYSEVPCLALCPRKERDSDWAETGSWCLDAWSWIPSKQRYVTPEMQSLDVYVSGIKWTDAETGWPGGWNVNKHETAVDNTESATLKINGKEVATARPWTGYFAIYNALAAGASVSYDVSASMRHVRCYLDSGMLVTGIAPNGALPLDFSDTASSLAADWACVRWNKRTHSDQLLVAIETGATVEVHTSTNTGTTWTLGASIGSGTKPTVSVSQDGRIFVYWIDGGSVKGKVFDKNLNTLVSTFSVTTADDEGCAAYERPTTGGGREFVLLYSSGGSVYRAVSSDGVTFGAGSSIGSGKKPFSFPGLEGTVNEGWLDGTDLKVRAIDLRGNVLVATNTVATSDNASAGIGRSAGANGQDRAVVLYPSSGANAQKHSFDSANWT